MALFQLRSVSDTLLPLPNEGGDALWNHILEPEYHQAIYVDACLKAQGQQGSIQLGDLEMVEKFPFRGVQPLYADDDSDVDSLCYEGLSLADGSIVPAVDEIGMPTPVCALKSICVRRAFVDFETARSAPRQFFLSRGARARIRRGDILINSTGDGTIGRVAVYDTDIPALVDGHITVVRLKQPEQAWYVAAYLLSEQGQRQIYRYINGSSGQVEIYPQDIARLWIPMGREDATEIGNALRAACRKYAEFAGELKTTLNRI